jgi:MFS transporter, FHS family, L-fucose permease
LLLPRKVKRPRKLSLGEDVGRKLKYVSTRMRACQWGCPFYFQTGVRNYTTIDFRVKKTAIFGGGLKTAFNSQTNLLHNSKMKTDKPLVPKELLFAFILITSLFFLWGIANDLTNPMVSAFKKVMRELTNFEAALVQLAFYGGYATMAIPAALFIRKYSYKAGIMVGLSLYSIGALLVYPAAAQEKFGFFLASLYILTFGLAFLETTSNPFILSMGPEETATRRLNLSQSFNPIGSLLGMLVAQLFVMGSLQSDDRFTSNVLNGSGEVLYSKGTQIYDTLSSAEQAAIRTNDLNLISGPYIALGLLVFAILIIVAFSKMPKKTEQVSLSIRSTISILRKNKRYYEGVITQAFYVGCQIMCWTFIFQYVDNLNSTRPEEQQITATWYNMVAMGAFLFGRAGSTYLLKYFNPGKLMFYNALAGILLTLGTIFLPGITGLYCLVSISLTMSLMFPTIYGLALRGMGDEAKLGSAGLVMAIVGGALLPPLQGRILDIGGSGFADIQVLGYIPEINLSFTLPLVCLIVVAIYSYRSFKYQI